MDIKFVEATQDLAAGFNYGKFGVGRFTDDEWREPAALPAAGTGSLLRARGWGAEHSWVLDLQTGEGAIFRLGGLARADLNRTRIWVCPLFEPFLEWLYEQYRQQPDRWWPDLPRLAVLAGAPAAVAGYRRPGPAADGSSPAGDGIAVVGDGDPVAGPTG